MTDQSPTEVIDRDSEPEAREESERPGRSLWTLAGIIALMVIVALVLLMLRGCDSGEGLDERGDKTISSVPGADPVAGVISIWIDDSAKIASVLRAAGVASESTTDLGEGRYLVVVGPGFEESSARRLAEQPEVFDVGRVYDTAE